MNKINVFNLRLMMTFLVLLLGISACSGVSPVTSGTDSQVVPVNGQAIASQELSFGQAVSTMDIDSAGLEAQPLGFDLQTRFIQVYQQANPAVVLIVNGDVSGSGFVYNEDGMIVTNNHVISGGRSFEVIFANGERQTARLLGADVDSDLAVIQVAQIPEGVQPLLLADDDLQVGQIVLAIGNPFGEQNSMSMGVVSGLGRSLPSQRGTSTGSTYTLPSVIQIDASINPGNSGGPLLNLDGEVVGINAAIATLSGANSGVGFSIPVEALKLIVPALIEKGSYDYPYMGINFDGEISISESELYGVDQTQGVYVIGISPGSPAQTAGLQAANPSTGKGGDLVVAIDGQTVRNFAELNSYLVFETRVGQTIQLTVLRQGREIEIPLTLGKRP